MFDVLHLDTNIQICVTGGMFNYVSGANFFGEILEWWGFFVLCPSLPSLAFAVFTTCNIGPRALQHHRYSIILKK